MELRLAGKPRGIEAPTYVGAYLRARRLRRRLGLACDRLPQCIQHHRRRPQSHHRIHLGHRGMSPGSLESLFEVVKGAPGACDHWEEEGVGLQRSRPGGRG